MGDSRPGFGTVYVTEDREFGTVYEHMKKAGLCTDLQLLDSDLTLEGGT